MTHKDRQDFSEPPPPCRHPCLGDLPFEMLIFLPSTLLRYLLCMYAWSYHLLPYTDLYSLLKPILQFFLLLFSPVWQIHWIFLSKHFPQLHLSFHKCLAFLLNAWLSSLTTYFVNSITARRASQSHPATSADRSYEHDGKDWNVEYMSISILLWAI